MVDPRFYLQVGPVNAVQLAGDAMVVGDGARLINGLAPAFQAGPEDLAWAEGRGVQISPTVGAIFIHPKEQASLPGGAVGLLSLHPRAAFARAASTLFVERPFQEQGAIAPDAQIEPGARLGPGVVVGPCAQIGAGAEVGPNAVIGPGVTIGRGSRVGACASVFCSLIGDGVSILPGARIGQTGFGVAVGPRGPVEIPHFGRVVVMDRALIGAGVTIDRGLFDDTVIGEDAKIDNLCQIAHNVTVGRGAIVAACAGISGSTAIGDGAVLAGRVGVADHRRIGARATLAAGSAVMHDVPDGETWGGYPAKPIRRWLREVAWLQRATGKREDGS